MSELRVALVAEGPTDAVIIQAALKALLPRPFVMTLLQPEPTRPKLGTGWGGVLRWCHEFATRGHHCLEDDPTLPGFDLFVIHVDADVAEDKYEAVSPEVASLACDRGWPTLPCRVPCPPPHGSADEMRCRLLCWAGLTEPGPRTVLCVPSKAPEAWLAAAVLVSEHSLRTSLECNMNLEAQLKALPKAERIRKTKKEYEDRSQRITAAWHTVQEQCSQAKRFSMDVLKVMA